VTNGGHHGSHHDRLFTLPLHDGRPAPPLRLSSPMQRMQYGLARARKAAVDRDELVKAASVMRKNGLAVDLSAFGMRVADICGWDTSAL
jgi:hypothetical protein